MRLITLVLVTALTAAAQFCKPTDFLGAYGFQLSGSTTISGESKPVASMGRLEFDGKGVVSGSSSVNFAGYFLGNPVTGAYEVKDDCTLTWSLQDDSGAFQHFSGQLKPDLQRATFQQTDQGGAANGTLAKVASQCLLPSLKGIYDASISGSAIPMNPGDTGARQIKYQGIVAIDDAGQLAILAGDQPTPAGTVSLDSDCIVDLQLVLYTDVPLPLRGVLVNDGKEILAIETAPGTTVNARLLQRKP